MFTTHAVGWEGVTHIRDYDYSKIIECAKKEKGFVKDSPEFKKFSAPAEITGYGHTQLAADLIPAILRGNLKDIYVVGGCDGSDIEREMYKDAMLSLPKSAAVITQGCAKFRLLGARDEMGFIPNEEK